MVSTIVQFIPREEREDGYGRREDGGPQFIFSVRPRGGFVASSRYIIAGDDCDRVYLTLQNRSLYT